jgi:hypothetical protein
VGQVADQPGSQGRFSLDEHVVPPFTKLKPTRPAGQPPTAVLEFAAVIASRSRHLPGSDVSSLLVTVIVAACTGVTKKAACTNKIKVKTKQVIRWRVMWRLPLSQSARVPDVIGAKERTGLYIYIDGQLLR